VSWETLEPLPAVQTRWRFSRHARDRLDEMQLEEDDALLVLRDPEVDYVQSDRDGRVAKRGRVSVAYDPDTRVVITVLWNTGDLYPRRKL
jgi:hypothetical protein